MIMVVVIAVFASIGSVAALLEMALASWIMRDLEQANRGLLAACEFRLGEVLHPGLREMLMEGTFSAP